MDQKTQSKKRINKLKKKDTNTDDQKQVKDEIMLFYNNLYKSNSKKKTVTYYLKQSKIT